MSAFIVGEEHIRYLVNAGLSRVIRKGYGLNWYLDGVRVGTLDGGDNSDDLTGQMLWDENFKSVNHRYNNGDDLPGPLGLGRTAPKYKHRLDFDRKSIDPVQVLKAIKCYEYQSCEHEGWEKSSANAFCEALRFAAIAALLGYDDAQWEVTAPVASKRSG
jgi:hypothetical protein